MDLLKVAAIQFQVTESLEKNLELTASLIKEAAVHQARLIVLPEMFAISGYFDNKLKIKENFGAGPIQDFLAEQAKKHSLWLVGGTIPLSTADSKRVSAACLVFNEQGELAGRYDKIHLFDVEVNEREYNESALIAAGEKTLVLDTPFGRLGVAVCYDLRFPELFRCLFNQKADLIAVPSAFTVETGRAHWEILCKCRAIENQVFLIAAAQTGGSSDRKTYGHSLIVGPWGNTLAELKKEESIVMAELDFQDLQKLRTKMPVQRQQKIFNTRT